MQLNTDLTPVNNQSTASTGTVAQTRNTENDDLKQADRLPEKISGEVQNLTRDEITVKTDGGQVIKARVLNPELISIGMPGEFKLSKTASGEIGLSLVSSSRQSMQSKVLADALAGLNIKVNDENMNILKMLLDNSFPATGDNFRMLNQAIKVVGNDNPESALFFLKNEITPSFKGAEALESYINGETKIASQLMELTENILSLENIDILEKAVSVLSSDSAKTQQINSQIKQLPDLRNELVQAADDVSKSLTNTLNTAAKEILGAVGEGVSSDNISGEKAQPLNSALIKETTLSENKQTDFELSPVRKFISENSREILDTIKEAALNGNTQRLTELIKNKFDFPDALNSLTEKDFFSELFKEFPALKKPVENLIKTEKSIKELLTEELSIGTDNIKEKNFEKHIASLSERLTKLKAELSTGEASSPTISQAVKLAENITGNISFFSSMQNTVFIQIPIVINNNTETAELYVFRDKNKKPKKAGQASALIALDTAFLGHFESYIQKNNQSVSCQFRLQNEAVQKIVSQNIDLLRGYLKTYNLNLENVTYKKISEPFNIISPEPDEEVVIIKDFTFDMQT